MHGAPNSQQPSSLTASPTLAFCSISALDRSIEDAARLAADAGLDGLEVTAHPPHLDPQAGTGAAAAAGRAVRAAGIAVVAYGSYLGRFGGRTRADAEREVAIAAALGAPLLRTWAEPDGGGLDDAAALLRAACDAAARESITVVVERHLGSFADTAERIAALFAAIDRPNAALNYQVLDFLPPEAATAQPADAAQLAGAARYFHLKNYQANEAPGGLLLPGGSLRDGVLDYRAILAAAFDAGYQGPLTIEFLAADARPLEAKLADDVAFVRSVLHAMSDKR
ncbi:MAG: TIM barrel protein [Deltaproteobacteria bacterium]|nr:TIM barrel protein [Deltaproteobacteria bacterium]